MMRKLKLAIALAGAMGLGVAIAYAAGLSTGNEFSTQTAGKTVVGFVEMVWNQTLGYAQPASSSNPVPVSSGPSPSGSGIVPIISGSAASGLVLKNAAGSLFGVYADSTASVWLMVFNSVTVPTNGATTAGAASGNMVQCVGPSVNPFIDFPNGIPEPYSAGISAALSTTPCATLTLSATGFIHGRVQ